MFLKTAETPYEISLTDTTGTDLSPWLSGTFAEFFGDRQGGLSVGVVQSSDATTDPVYLNPNNARVWYSNQVYHATPAYLNVLSNGILRSTLGTTLQNPSDYGISVFNSPVVNTGDASGLNANVFQQLLTDTILSLSVIFALAFLPASFIVILVDENEVGAKHLQLVAGLQQAPFWIANWLWDFALYIFATVLTFLCFLAFNEEAYVSSSNWFGFLLLLLLYGWAVIPMEYPFYRLFRQSGSAYVAMLAFNVVLGVGLCAMIFTLEFLAQDDEGAAQAYDILKWALLIIPHFAFGQGMIQMGFNWAVYSTESIYNPNAVAPNPLDIDIIGKNLLFLFFEGLLFIILLILWESWLERTREVKSSTERPFQSPVDEDPDVKEERKKIADKVEELTPILKVESLNKKFQRPKVEKKKKLGGNCCTSCCTCSCLRCCCCAPEKVTMTAVQSLSFSVQPGECFGLLGVNGAGKTTTFRMITGEMSPDYGKVQVNGISMADNPSDARQILGYCPQSDALNVLLTSSEHLRLYARIRGTPEDKIDPLIKDSLNIFGLAGTGNLKNYVDFFSTLGISAGANT